MRYGDADTEESREAKRARWGAHARPKAAPQYEYESPEHERRDIATARIIKFGGFGLLALIMLAVIAVMSVSNGGGEEPRQSRMGEAIEACGEVSDYIDYNSQREVIRVSGDSAGDATAVSCLLGATGAPERVMQDIQQTTALQGNRSDSWMGYTGSWNYHPARGIDFILER